MKIVKYTAAVQLTLLSFLFVQGQELPINPDTKLVSISNVVLLDSITRSDLKQRIEEWIALSSNSFQTLFNVERSSKRKRKEKVKSIPSFTFEKKLDTETKCIYFIILDNTPKVRPLEQKYAHKIPDMELIQFNLIVLFKDGKLKYEFTNFAHVSGDPLRNHSGGKFENEKPDAKRYYMNKSYWKGLKLKTIEKVILIAGNLEQYVVRPVNTEMNF